jgi:hypothetical protein
VLFLQQRVLALKRLELLELPRRSRGDVYPSRTAPEDAVAHFLAPARQHERMDVEGIGDGLHLDPRHVAQLHGRQFEFNAVAMNLLGPWLAHATPPSVS